MKKEKLFTSFVLMIKRCWKNIIIFELLFFAVTFFGYVCQPIYRGFNVGIGITFFILFIIFGILSLVYLFIFLKNYDTKKIITSGNEDRFFFVLSSLFLNGLLMTIILLIIRTADPENELLIQGFFGLIILLVYFLSFIFVTYFNAIFTKEKRK